MRMIRGLGAFRQDAEGGILVFWAVSMTVFFGIVALSFDIGRMASTQSELQSFADNVALAAAGELDGAADAIVRAETAAATLIRDSQTFGGGGQALDSADYVLTPLHSLPPQDDEPWDISAYETSDPAAAAYVHVQVAQHEVSLTFAAAFAALRNAEEMNNAVSAEAVAGFTSYACDITPMMFCLPGPDFKADEHVGEMILLRSGGNSGAWGPGNFGFLNTSDMVAEQIVGACEGLSNVQLTACQLAATGGRTGCFAQRGVDTKPGQNVGNLESAFNTRFGLYEKASSKMGNDPDFAAAPNVVQGRVFGPSCKPEPSLDTAPLPRDSCFAAGTCDNGNRFGDGVFDWSEYVTKNHNGVYPAGTTAASTRYEMYLAEIAAAGASTNPILPGKSETGRPQCAKHMTTEPDRRTIIAAGVDCTANLIKGSANDVPVKEFVKLFLTHPAGLNLADATGEHFDIWAEIVGSVGGGAGGGSQDAIFHDLVQLYR